MCAVILGFELLTFGLKSFSLGNTFLRVNYISPINHIAPIVSLCSGLPKSCHLKSPYGHRQHHPDVINWLRAPLHKLCCIGSALNNLARKLRENKLCVLAPRCQDSLDGANGFPGVADEEGDVTQLRHRRQEAHVVRQPVHVLENAEVILKWWKKL